MSNDQGNNTNTPNPFPQQNPGAKPKWVLFETVGYLLGYGLHYYSRTGRILNPKSTCPGVGCVAVDSAPGDVDHVGIKALEILADRSLNWVMLDVFGDDDPVWEVVVKTALRKLKPNGHLISLSKKGFRKFPKLTQKKEVTKDGWYLGVFKNGPVSNKPNSRPRALIARYGAFGDLVMITPLIRALSEEGYHVTCNVQSYSATVLKHNPFVDNMITQEREAIPNHWLGEYWDYWKPQYDKYINLSESIEGKLLKVEGRRDFYTTKEWRNEEFGSINYQDFTMKLGGYPDRTGELPEIYFSKAEEKKVKKFIDSAHATGRRFLMMCPLRGSSHHKQYPLLGVTLETWLKDKPDVEVILTGDTTSLPLVFEHPQVTSLVHSPWTLREIMLMTKYVNVVLGPETGIINAASSYDTPKIVYLSHSSADNLAKYWKNTQILEPDAAVAQCYPCHQLHYTLESCPLGEIVGPDNKPLGTVPICAAGAVRPEKIIEALNNIYSSSTPTVL